MIDPNQIFRGKLAVLIPHMDDGVLGCGGTVARIEQKANIHFIYISDGISTLSSVLSRKCISQDIGAIRTREAREALKILGVLQENISFLDYPAGKLSRHIPQIEYSLMNHFAKIKPQHILFPFRYDCHKDHLAINRAMCRLLQTGVVNASMFEYFIYYNWRLLPKGDIRKYIHPEQLVTINIETAADQKRDALQCFKSQVTKFYPWQNQPVLSKVTLEKFIKGPEIFLKTDTLLSKNQIFISSRLLIRIVHAIEPTLKRKKDGFFDIANNIFSKFDS